MAIYRILENMIWNRKRKREKGGWDEKKKYMPKRSGGTGIIDVESNSVEDLPHLNTLVISCVSCTCASVP